MSLSVLILGLGNPLRGDDGIGPRVVEELNRRGLPDGVTALDGGSGGFELLRVWEGWERVVVVDAAELVRRGGEQMLAGEFARFTPQEVHLARAHGGSSLHDAGLAEALALAEAMGQALPEMVIFGVQPERVGWGEGLSPAVEAALPALVGAVLDEVDKFLTRDA